MPKSRGATSGGTGMKKTLSVWNFFITRFGAITGTGQVLLVGGWVIIGGGPITTMVAFLVGVIFLLPIGAVFGELTAATPISGGIIEYVDRTYGSNISYITGWFLAPGNDILCPWEVIAISTLAFDMFGGLFPILKAVKLYTIMGADVYLLPMMTALGFALYVISLNFRGVSAMAKLQAFLTRALLADMLLATGISFIKDGPSNIPSAFPKVTGPSSTTSANNMFAGIISVLVMTPFFYAGFDTVPQQAEETTGGLSWDGFGKVISMTLLTADGFYMICIYSFGTIIPWTEFVQSTTPALTCLKNINMVLYVAMLTIATLGPIGPINSFYGATSHVMLAMRREGQLPSFFAEIDGKGGAPKTVNMAPAVLTVVRPFLSKSMLASLTNVSALAFILPCTMVSFACLKMRETEPDLSRPYKASGGKLGISMACLAGSIIITLMVAPFSSVTLKPVEWAIVAGWLVIGLTLKAVSSKKST